MKTLTPAKMLKYTTDLAYALEAAKKRAVFVGLPKDKVGSKVYGDGMTVIRNGAIHEFGAPQQSVPQRSFLRVPFRTKGKEINAATADQFKRLAMGKITAEVALGRVGVIATNISKGAFTSKGYGTWQDISDETKQRKGSTQVLIDTGVLRGSITWVVRNAT
jgi:phage gpG-like protein